MLFETERTPELSDRELSVALRKQINSYQINTRHRLTSGQDHWEWFCGPGSTRLDFVFKILENLRSRLPIAPGIAPKLLTGKPRGKPVHAFVQDGRWVAQCECKGQEVVDIEDPVFVCLNPICFNLANRNWPRPVVFPKEKDMREAAEALLARPNPVNRNWDVAGVLFNQPETSARLRGENKAYGYPERVVVTRRKRHGIGHTL